MRIWLLKLGKRLHTCAACMNPKGIGCERGRWLCLELHVSLLSSDTACTGICSCSCLVSKSHISGKRWHEKIVHFSAP